MENVAAAALVGLEAAGVRHREVATDRGGPVVVVADEVVVASAAVEVPLHGVPLGRDVGVDAVPVEVVVDVGVAGGGLSEGLSQLESREDGSDLANEGDGHEDGVHDQQAAVLQPGDGDAEEADEENVDAEDDDVHGHHEEHFIPEVELFNLVELHEDDRAEDEDDGCDEEEHCVEVDVPLVLVGAALHEGQSRPRAGVVPLLVAGKHFAGF